MNEQLQTIYDFLIGINALFPSMSFKCGYGASKLSYIVEVSPKQAYNNGDYAIKELEFAKKFETKYTDDIVIFVEEGDACGIKDCIFTIGSTESISNADKFIMPQNIYMEFVFANSINDDGDVSILETTYLNAA